MKVWLVESSQFTQVLFQSRRLESRTSVITLLSQRTSALCACGPPRDEPSVWGAGGGGPPRGARGAGGGGGGGGATPPQRGRGDGRGEEGVNLLHLLHAKHFTSPPKLRSRTQDTRPQHLLAQDTRRCKSCPHQCYQPPTGRLYPIPSSTAANFHTSGPAKKDFTNSARLVKVYGYKQWTIDSVGEPIAGPAPSWR
jgi:hypothetical protein